MASLKSKIAEMQSGRAVDRLSRVVRILLLPASWVYALTIMIRNALYQIALFKSLHLPGKTISIGNITTGGTGKTPVTMMLAQLLQDRGVKFAILTRGYGAAYEHSEIVFNSARVDRETIDWLSDEVVMMAEKLQGCWIGVGKDRYRNGLNLSRRQNIGLFLLDDGFQHRRLARAYDIVVIDATSPFGNGSLLPAGNLRERISALKRASCVLLTRTESLDSLAIDQLTDRIERFLPRERIFYLLTRVEAFRDLVSGERYGAEVVRDKQYWLFSGIGNPRSFDRIAAATGIMVAGHTVFGDHHRYSEGDFEELLTLMRRHRCEALLTTEKDAVKAPTGIMKPGDCFVIEISFAFAGREDIFINQITEVAGAPV